MKLTLVTIPNQLLRQKSQKIGFVDNSIRALAENMAETASAWDRESEIGAAIAAVQVGQPLKLTSVRNNFTDYDDKTFSHFINPEIVKVSSEMVTDIEGCLSVPGIYGRLPRYTKIKVKAYDLDMHEVRLTLEGFPARLFQHEIDHMKGIIFLDHVKSAKDLLQIDNAGKLRPVSDDVFADLEKVAHHEHD